MTRIFTPDDTEKYTKTRLSGRNISLEMCPIICVYNGFLPSEVERKVGDGFEIVEQDNGREPLFYKSGVLSIPQYSGYGRERRYSSMIRAYVRDVDHKLKTEFLFRNDDPRETAKAYMRFSRDYVTGLFVPTDMDEPLRVFEDIDISGITDIIYGPIDAVARNDNVKVIQRSTNEYLEAQIVEIEGKKVFNLGYVYSDQAGRLTDMILEEFYAISLRNKKPIELTIYMFGRLAGLEKSMKRHDLIFPNAIIDEEDVEIRRDHIHSFENILSPTDEKVISLNVMEPVEETYEGLGMAREAGCSCIEIESEEIAESIKRARRFYRNHLSAKFGFVGYVSDLPLQGDTLATELDNDLGERNAVNTVVEHIRH